MVGDHVADTQVDDVRVRSSNNKIECMASGVSRFGDVLRAVKFLQQL